MATRPGVLPTVDGVGSNLAEQVHCCCAVDRNEVCVIGDDIRGVHNRNRKKANLFISVEPGVQLWSSSGEGGDRESLKFTLVQIRDFASLMQAHEPGGEHL
ncbi:unannotated protein [freshwater metagenome]|uniref:Unannotated protein n=1 Tax=freshwater metagenome TaxID=449393 RepID=A0A6J6ZE05_9ZZZZ